MAGNRHDVLKHAHPLAKAAALGAVMVAGVANAAPNPYPPPPPVQVEAPPKPPVSGVPLVWQPGRYEWNGTGYVFYPGAWVPRDGHGTMWQPGFWAQTSGGWVWQPGHWL